MVQIPFTTCFPSPIQTTLIPTTCGSPLPSLTWVEDEGTSSPVVIIECPETSTTRAAPSPTSVLPITMACQSPVTHTSSITLEGGSVTAVTITVCPEGISLFEDPVSTVDTTTTTESSEQSAQATIGSDTSFLDYPTAFTPTVTEPLNTETTLVLDTRPPPGMSIPSYPAAF